MKIFYWSPFLSNIATVDSVINSIKSIKYYDNEKKINPIIIDSVGEWSQKKLDNHVFNIRQLYNYKVYNFLPRKGYLKSRISQILIFVLSFNSLRKLLIKEVPELIENKVQLNFIGDIPRFSKSLISQINSAMKDTQVNTPNLNLNVAISYGGRWDILNAIKRLKDHKINIDKINEDDFSKLLSTSNFPDPDLLIRTGDEIRISNFFLWQISYSELYFSKLLWPDFKLSNFKSALKRFSSRSRRFGKE